MNNSITEKNKKRYLPHYGDGIKHHKIQPRTLQHNGKVERSHRNDNESFIVI